jgi:hypothetical protein
MIRNNKSLLRLLTVVSTLIGAGLLALPSINAALRQDDFVTHVEIDGLNYGPIDQIDGIEKFADDGYPMNEATSYETVRLSREFVTDPSLYLWAKNRMSRKLGLKDIHLITEDDNGQIVSRRILQLCQPLSWTVETQNPSLGGFNETIDLAVQKVTVF